MANRRVRMRLSRRFFLLAKIDIGIAGPRTRQLPVRTTNSRWRRLGPWRHIMLTWLASFATSHPPKEPVSSTALHVYSTDIGEHRAVTLSGGDKITLDTNSSLLVGESQDCVTIRIVSGQAIFMIQHRSERRVEVLTDHLRVIDIGTTFDVREGVSGSTVTVVEGSLEVRPLSTDPRDSWEIDNDSDHLGHGLSSIVLTGGQRVEVAAATPSIRVTAQTLDANKINAAIAWQHDELIFDSTPAADAAREFNRYNRTPQIRIEDPTLASLKVSGRFYAHDPAIFVSTLKNLDRRVRLRHDDFPNDTIILSRVR